MQIGRTRRLPARVAALVVLIGCAMLAASLMAAPNAHARMNRIAYGECTYACDAMRRRCFEKSVKLDGAAACDIEHRNCRDRCERERDKDGKPEKPFPPQKPPIR